MVRYFEFVSSGLITGKSTPSGLFNAKMWFFCRYLITIMTHVSQKFCNILAVYKVQFCSSWCFCQGRKRDQPHWAVRYQPRLIPSERKSLGLPQFVEHGLRIYNFKSTWPNLVIRLLATFAKFNQPSGHCTVINCALTFLTINVFVPSGDYGPVRSYVEYLPVRL